MRNHFLKQSRVIEVSLYVCVCVCVGSRFMCKLDRYAAWCLKARKHFVFGDVFEMPAAHYNDDSPILLEDIVEFALKAIKNNINKSDNGKDRVPPLAITSVARSGKTTLLREIQKSLNTETDFITVMVDFNGSSNFQRLDYESDDVAFLRWFTKSVIYGQKLIKDPNSRTCCGYQELVDYISQPGKPIVLLVDELNKLVGLEGVSPKLACILRDFLAVKGRYLCFTSHYFVSSDLEKVRGFTSHQFVSSDLEKVLGSRMLRTDTRAPDDIEASPRGVIFCPVPRLQLSLVNKVELLAVWKDTLAEKTIRTLTGVQIALCLGSVGLVVSMYGDNQFKPDDYFGERMIAKTKFPLKEFLYEFCDGKTHDAAMRAFDLFTTRTQHNHILWPLCFAREFIKRCETPTSNCYHAAKLMKDPSDIAGASVVNTGLDWEFIARAALAIVALLTVYRPAGPLATRVLGVPQGNTITTFKIFQFGEYITDPEEALKQVTAYATSNAFKKPLLVLGYPSHADFACFDTLTCFVADADSSPIVIGQQMKLGRGLPRKNPPKEFNRAVLLRGHAPQRRSRPSKRRNWDYLSREEVEEFCPFSIRPLIPLEWRVRGDAQVKRACTHPHMRTCMHI